MNEQTYEIVAYFRGEFLTEAQWQARISRVTTLVSTYPEDMVTLVDKYWIEHVNAMTPSLLERIRELLKLVKEKHGGFDKRIPISFTGHGIGGAYAVLSALRFNQAIHTTNGWPVNLISINTVTFGEPRIGDESFAKRVNRELNVFRVTHTNDYFPHYPKGGFRHHDIEYWFSDQDCNCSHAEDSQIKVLKCTGDGGPNGESGENPNCNLGQESTKENARAHIGPYFDIVIGSCEITNNLPFSLYFLEDKMIPLHPWLTINDYYFTDFKVEPYDVVMHMVLSWEKLYEAGIRNFLLPTNFDLVSQPAYKASSQSFIKNLDEITRKDISIFKIEAQKFKDNHKDTKIYIFETAEFFNRLMSTLVSLDSEYNIRDECVISDDNTLHVNPNTKKHFFFDAYHPETRIHAALALGFAFALLTDPLLLKFFKRTAIYANIPYCNNANEIGQEHEDVIADIFKNENTGEIVAYFRGPQITVGKKVTKASRVELFSETRPISFSIDSILTKALSETIITRMIDKISLLSKNQTKITTGTATNESIKVYMTGHGIGGGYAALLGIIMGANINVDKYAKMKFDFRPLYIYIVTFGQSRIGDKQLASLANRMGHWNPFFKIYRVTNSNDFAPHQPSFTEEGAKLIHFGKEYWISDSCNCTNFYVCPGDYLLGEVPYGESEECNLSTDGLGFNEHFGPYFGTTFGDCSNFSL
ncbi:hypothetical protein G9A89_008632 [Geosiphon pyriformis]|nr:hypothetical protein G9A89_008632 [Geosiphon pyriformis]